MKLSTRDAVLLEQAKTLPADVLCLAAKHQAENNMLSEAWCTEIAGHWNDAAETARNRRDVTQGRSSVFSDDTAPLRRQFA